MTHPLPSKYWAPRIRMIYYNTVEKYILTYCPDGKSMLDVGAGVGMGARYLERFPDWDRTAIELPGGSHSLDGVRVINEDFMDAPSSIVTGYDVVLCLQVLEHLEDPAPFARKLLTAATVVIVSVPYKCPAGKPAYHVQNPIDEEKLNGWMGLEPIDSEVASNRLVSVYVQETAG